MEWIDVKDKLPDGCEDVLVACVDEGEGTYTGIGWVYEDECVWDFEVNPIRNNNSETVTHWMPLPKPPKTK